jgi:hypothetical protein
VDLSALKAGSPRPHPDGSDRTSEIVIKNEDGTSEIDFSVLKKNSPGPQPDIFGRASRIKNEDRAEMNSPLHQPPFPHSYSGSNCVGGLISPIQRLSHSSHENLPASDSASAKRLNSNASAFVPSRTSRVVFESEDETEVDLPALKAGSPRPHSDGSDRTSKIVIKNEDGIELDLSALKKESLGRVFGSPFNVDNGGFMAPHKRPLITIESYDTKKLRMAEENAKTEELAKLVEETLKKDAEKKARREEQERAAAIKRKEEMERVRK